MDTNDALRAFAALGQRSRLDALRLLVRAGPEGIAAGEIARALDQRQNTLSTNLAILRDAGLLHSARDGRSVRYAVDWLGVRGLIAFLMQDCCGGRPELCQPVLDALVCQPR
ncbi:helix-turn-helix transcriptional regulator [Jannaschia sp. LMIT008]|uniref:ArsR/SmtB family transcription factor n=1 Tax=Jannaschia maritima TaxID=3032585 RepID=UPI0028113272|nr:helix-turn-helix transcriptional regulator [Jannaschia sp. LMIT008]